LHVPLASQVFRPEQASSSCPLTTLVHVPAALAQERHAVVHAVVQHRPSRQLPVAHSWSAEQSCPAAFLHAPAALQVLAPEQ
jgi:hypothetical protein